MFRCAAPGYVRARERIGATVMASMSAYQTGGTVRVPGLARCIAGTKSGRAAHTGATARDSPSPG
jgi:hypothetical protein